MDDASVEVGVVVAVDPIVVVASELVVGRVTTVDDALVEGVVGATGAETMTVRELVEVRPALSATT